MTPLAVIHASTPLPVGTATDPATYWVPAIFVFVAALINIAAVLWATRLSGRRSDAALKRTIEADRLARIHERRLDLYGEILTFAAKRKQHRDVTMTLIVVNGMERLDPFEPAHVFELGGRTTAIAHVAVLEAWNAADAADMAAVRAWNAVIFSRGDPTGSVKYTEKAFAAKEAADATDIALERKIRRALHQRVPAAAEPGGDKVKDAAPLQRTPGADVNPQEGGNEQTAAMNVEG